MLPEGEESLLLVDETETEEEQMTGRTYRLDEKNEIIAGEIDGREAIKQSLLLILQTEREEFEIYSGDYGIELMDLIGQTPPLVYVNLEQVIKEALMQDDRVEDVGDFSFERLEKHAVSVKFTVTTIEGDIDMETEVNING
ncbi:DUF2634 domain-containing protein [Anaerovorax odorimutans]|uniref:DUF2634 domain-containing protein n=1 Tax=Anaerovorax odorimutans TaxID=109327 RepID=A0ABT1RPQ4_9FIRM|nr:DUF2634 domain-containing protein [Anaerovorax odorimutans]MCQ4637149.1 DUF2634 domain-containing protein [Anaerovorax odorimutans]